MKTNEQLLADVRAELAWDPRVDDTEIRVTAVDGIVTLAGWVPSYADRWARNALPSRCSASKQSRMSSAASSPLEAPCHRLATGGQRRARLGRHRESRTFRDELQFIVRRERVLD
jgi:hypothetical protein